MRLGICLKTAFAPPTEYGISMENLEVSEVQREREDEQSYACHEFWSLLGI